MDSSTFTLPSLSGEGGAPELGALCERIIASGALGRSPTYSRLLRYLCDASLGGRQVRELEIAIEALGRADDFDVSSDSAVRVAMHQLRKKLQSYYATFEPDAEYRLILPKGRYSLHLEPAIPSGVKAALPADSASAVEGVEPSASEARGWPWRAGDLRFGSWLNSLLLLVVASLLAANLVSLRSSAMPQASSTDLRAGHAADHPLWARVLADEKPVLIVMGDYYIFGELNASGNVARMVREFNVNSSSDLEDLRFSELERTEKYLDLDLSYMPEGSAFALAKIVPVLQKSGKTINISMMSDVTAADIRANHIVYIGYISALDRLTGMVFAGSGLTVGRSYDELLELSTARYFTSDAGLPEKGQAFRDYGFFSSLPSTHSSQLVVVAGMRDAGLMHMAQALSERESLNEIVLSLENDTDEALGAVEALYEVFGVDRMNFEGRLVYSHLLDSESIWGGI